ncbi:MAG: DNA topoisomerase IB [bacterium]|nr:DNA topoisomerase IB [bacterium]
MRYGNATLYPADELNTTTTMQPREHDQALDQFLESAALRYASDQIKGYTRKKRGKGFTYFDRKGGKIDDPALKAWIDALVIPPAWTDVWISPHKNGHILATGRDGKGRKQYIYHPAWRELSNEKKFENLIEFGEMLPHIRQTLADHLRQKGITAQKMLALVVTLLDRTLIRVGNQEYRRDNDTYGLTTLQDHHAAVQGESVTFDFVGKSGKPHTIHLDDKRLAKIVRQSQELPGYALFQYVDANGQPRAVDSSHVNAYLQAITGKPFTAKIFRTWGGSVQMVRELCTAENDGTVKGKEKCVRAGVKAVAKALGNTTSVSRAYYIHPLVIDSFMDGRLAGVYEQHLREMQTGETDALKLEEQVLMALMLTARDAALASPSGGQTKSAD